MKKDRGEELLRSGILDPDDQKTAEELFERAKAAGGEVKDSTTHDTASATVTRTRRRGGSMEVSVWGNGGIETRLVRGKRGWQDNGASGETGGSSSIDPSEGFHPDTDQRRETLRKVAQRTKPQQP